jgi:hypothetical protein
MTQLAVICAPPPWPNPGMATVDLALGSVLRRSGIRAMPRYFQLYSMAQHLALVDPRRRARALARHQLPFDYRSLLNGPDEALDSDAVVFWGDYTHAHAYVHDVAGILADARLKPSYADALHGIYDTLFLDRCDDRALARTLTCGETLLSNGCRAYSDPSYARHAERFYRRVAGVSMRDPYSAMRVMRFRGDDEVPIGSDCALLIADEDIAALPRSAWTATHELPDRPVVGVFFGRTTGDVRPIGRFVGDLCHVLGLTAQWLPWLDGAVPPSPRDEMSSCCSVMTMTDEWETPPTLGDVLGRLAAYRCVVTDTYHLCVNAWRVGVPALCIGEALVPPGTCDVSAGWSGAWCDKRHVFYAAHEAAEYYVFREELERDSTYDARLQLAARLIDGDVGVDVIRCHIRTAAARAERRFIRQLRRVLDAP